MSLGLLFPGQGTQHPTMLAWLDQVAPRSPALEEMETRLGRDWRHKLLDPYWAHQNDVAQVLLTGTSLAAWSTLCAQLPPPRAVAGYSVGELAAFSAAGVLQARAAVQLADQRAAIMNRCVGTSCTGLLALHGPDAQQIDALCARFGATVAIHLGLNKWVIGGTRSQLDSIEQACSLTGATTTHLNVPLASHTPWLEKGVQPLSDAVQALAFGRPVASVICNLHGHTERQADGLRAALAQQIASPVQWARCMSSLHEEGVTCVLELGPGSSLSRLWNASYPDVPARSVDEFQHPEGVVAWVLARLND